MKKLILFLFLFLFNAYGAQNKDVLLSKTMGSCSTHDLSFSALRFTKVPLKSEGENVFLRLIFFISEEGKVTSRLTLQELLGCQMSKEGEICSYRPLRNQWAKMRWAPMEDGLSIEGIGRIKIENDTFKISIDLAPDFPFAEVRGMNFSGAMVRVNFNEAGTSTDKICQVNPGAF